MPDDRNAAIQVAKVLLLYGSKNITLKATDYDLFAKLPAAAQLNDRQYAILRQHADKTPAVWPEALKLKDCPEGATRSATRKTGRAPCSVRLQDRADRVRPARLRRAVAAQDNDGDGPSGPATPS